MPVSYRFVKVIKFGHREGYTKPIQLTLDGFEEEAECRYKLHPKYKQFSIKSSALTAIQPSLNQQFSYSLSDEIKVIPYECYIEIIINKRGKVFHTEFNRYLEANEFIFYFLPELDMFLFAAQREVVDEFVKVMNSDPNSELELLPLDVNYKALQPLIPIITGVWFGDMNKQYLKTAGYFGKNVDKSIEFQQALEDNAKISQLLFDYHFNGETFTIAVTKNSSIILYSRVKYRQTKIPDISSEIQLALQIFVNFIIPGNITVTS